MRTYLPIHTNNAVGGGPVFSPGKLCGVSDTPAHRMQVDQVDWCLYHSANAFWPLKMSWVNAERKFANDLATRTRRNLRTRGSNWREGLSHVANDQVNTDLWVMKRESADNRAETHTNVLSSGYPEIHVIICKRTGTFPLRSTWLFANARQQAVTARDCVVVCDPSAISSSEQLEISRLRCLRGTTRQVLHARSVWPDSPAQVRNGLSRVRRCPVRNATIEQREIPSLRQALPREFLSPLRKFTTCVSIKYTTWESKRLYMRMSVE